MEDWETATFQLDLPEEVENTPYEDEKIPCPICGQEFSILNSLTQHKRTCLPGTQVFKELLGGNITIDEIGFKDYLIKYKWDILIKAWIIDTLKSKHALDVGKISNPVNAHNTECYVSEQSYFIPWMTTQLYLLYLGKPNIIEGLSGFSGNTAKSIEKIKLILMKKGEHMRNDKFPIWNGWRKYFKNIFILGKFNVMNLEPIVIYETVNLKPIKKVTKNVEEEKEKERLKKEIKELTNQGNFFVISIEQLTLLKEKVLYQLGLYDELGLEKTNKFYFDEYYDDFSSFQENINLHKDFFKKYLMDNDLTISSFQEIIENLKKMTSTPYFPIVFFLEEKFKKFDENATIKDKKQMLINLRRCINTGKKIKGDNLFSGFSKFNVFKNILDYFETSWN